jgi:hypothetical protein
MGAFLADRLAAARARAFVGRAAEIELFRQALSGPDPPFSVLWFHGPGGVGKSTLLSRLADEAVAAGRTPILFDARSLDLTPAGLGAALRDAAPGPDRILFLDTAELLTPVDDCLRTQLLPGLPASSLVVVAGRTPPPPAWREDAGWQAELRQVALRNLDPDDAAAYLHARGVPDDVTDAVLRFTHGHPLALALITDVLAQRVETASDLTAAEVADVVPTLLERFVADVPDPAHRTALQVLAHNRQTTEALLKDTVGPDRAAECFAWLRDLSFTKSGPEGLYPHDLARDVLDLDLRWRDPQGWADLHRQVRAHILGRIVGSAGWAQAVANADFIYLHRHSSGLRPYFSFDVISPVWWEPAVADDLPDILELVRRREGEESLAWHRAWAEREVASFVALRSRGTHLHGFSLHLRLDADGGRVAREIGDPFAVAATDRVERTAPLRRGQHILLTRQWLDVDGHYEPTPSFQAVATADTAMWLGDPAPALSVMFMPDPEFWTPFFAYIDHAHAEDGDLEFDGRSYAMFLHDWRVTPRDAWLELMEPRERGQYGGALELARRHVRTEPVVALSRADFAAHVRDALRVACRPGELERSPLLRSRLVAAPAGGEASPADLRAVLERGVEALAADPATARYARVLDVTHLLRATTQEAAAARLNLPFSTYRRHLRAGTEALADVLWEWEIHGETTPGDPVPS